MQTIGSHETPGRYERHTVKVRILQEIKRRITTKDWRFNTVAWGVVQNHPINDDYNGSEGAVLAILPGVDIYGVNAQKYENNTEVTLEFAVKPGDEEEPLYMVDIIAGELLELLAGSHTLKEGGEEDGVSLSCKFQPVSFEPEIEEGNVCARGYLTFSLTYRHATHKPFDLVS